MQLEDLGGGRRALFWLYSFACGKLETSIESVYNPCWSPDRALIKPWFQSHYTILIYLHGQVRERVSWLQEAVWADRCERTDVWQECRV